MKSVALHNLGCKVNSYESDVMRQKLRERGFVIVPFEETADIYIVNTCSVTNIADRKSRQMLHQAKKRNPEALVVAVGCYVQTGREKLMTDAAVDLLIGNNRKNDIAEILEEYLKTRNKTDRETRSQADGAAHDKSGDKSVHKRSGKTLDGSTVIDISQPCPYEEMQLRCTAGHTRAYIKIQDGCSQFCSYCIIPYARGRIRSRREEDIIEEVKALVANGFKEIVITGIHISSYGMDLEGGKNVLAGETFPSARLLALLKRLDGLDGLFRIRLGSLEPRIMTPGFVEGLKGLTKLCHHFHLSLQSGCDETLRRMNRHYTTGEYLKKVNLLREAFDRPAITTDIIVGFPGETQEEFEETKSFLEKAGLYEIHVFQYSRRQGTAAAKRRDQVPEKIKKQRSEILLSLTKKQSESFRKSYIGRDVRVLFEEGREILGEACQVGYTGEYIRAAKRTPESLSGQIQAGRLTGFAEENLLWLE